jgi:hypothetical protein
LSVAFLKTGFSLKNYLCLCGQDNSRKGCLLHVYRERDRWLSRRLTPCKLSLKFMYEEARYWSVFLVDLMVWFSLKAPELTALL